MKHSTICLITAVVWVAPHVPAWLAYIIGALVLLNAYHYHRLGL